tara:strand:+ start:16710 stop:18779 length:2070 start_codon:yes stop_codon:yes gene_type:complete
MNIDIDLEKKIISLINDFNSKKYKSIISQVNQLITSDIKVPIFYNLLGASYSAINMDIDAVRAYQDALKIDPKNEEIIRNLAKSYSKLNELDTAYEYFERANTIRPNNADTLFGMGLLDLKNKNYIESVKKFNLAIKFSKHFFQAYYNLAIAQSYLGKLIDAKKSYLEAIKINKNYRQAYNNLGSILIKTKNLNEAINVLESAIKIKPDYLEALINLGVANLELKKYEIALKYFNRALATDPMNVKAISQKLYLMRKICDWSEDDLLEKNLHIINESKIDVTPWQLLSLDDDPKIELIRAKKYGNQFCFKNFNSSFNNSKIKLAYFTSDFYDHAGMINMEGIFKYHDKNKFEIYAFDYGYFHNDSTHQRIKNYFDHFLYINELNDDEVVKIIKEQKIDIAIHRNGYSQNSRNSLFSNKIAPLQISFLGYPGTMGVKFIDYIIADKIVIPDESRKYFSEKIIYLPDSYYPTNNERKISTIKFNRKEYNISEESFVFGSFNNSYKISSKEFSLWVKLLEKINNSYLILLINDDLTKKNLTDVIKNHNLDPSRVKFVNFINNDEHLARHHLIDLYLDTFNYNGHTSSVDALYCGVPVLTKKGKSFSSRVCASLLEAAQMSELIVSNEEEYFKLAFDIATNAEKYKKIKNDLKEKLKTASLFNTKKYVKNLEKGFELALNKKIKNEKIDHIKI